ncbi:MAG: hypothetical protein A7315_04310 [Candidatus Altiarchaeales archaeon WOR_SM1_79]|nr:MAG: hypothetical protein A7315_04310 [Candidatus Altiarchaeales archaeon WOR_SM1_79]
MPHKCIRCGREFEDDDPVLVEGCKCGASVFLYKRAISPERKKELEEEKDQDKLKKRLEETRDELEETKKELDETKKELEEKEITQEDLKWIDKTFGRVAEETKKPISLDIETIRMVSRGKFGIDVGGMLAGKPVVMKAKDGVYYIDLPSAMKRIKK